MKIQKVTITTKELTEAVGQWMKTQGIGLKVESVDREYAYGSTWKVEFEDPTPPEPEPAPPTDPAESTEPL